MRRVPSYPPDTPTLLIGRFGGLPTQTVEPFSCDLYETILERSEQLEPEAQELRSRLVDLLYEHIGDADKPMRNLMLALKRDCFNDRSLDKYRQKSKWARVLPEVRELVERVIEIDEELAQLHEELEVSHRKEKEAQEQYLLSFYRDSRFLRGLTLASPVLARNLRSVMDGKRLRSNKRRSLLTSLLRYVSRAALKTSPYSTLTPIGIGSGTLDDSFTGIRLVPEPWNERSSVRLKRFLLDQLTFLLLRHPPFRRHLEAHLNSTARLGSDGRCHFVRPGHWFFDPEASELRYRQDCLVRVRLGGDLIADMRELLQNDSIAYGTLQARLTAGKDDSPRPEERVAETLDKLQEIGFLELVLPWPTHTAHLEKEILTYLSGHELASSLEPLLEALADLLELETEYAQSADVVRHFYETEAQVHQLWETGAQLVDLPRSVDHGQDVKGNIYEDVFVEAEGTAHGETFEVPERQLHEIARHMDPLMDLGNFYNHCLDFLKTLNAVSRQLWPHRSKVPFLDVFAETQELWTDFTTFRRGKRRAGGWKSTFNPMELPELETVDSLRDEVWSQAFDCVDVLPEETRILTDRLLPIVEQIPGEYRSLVGPALFLQPADEDGELWVMNRVYEGTGRFGSRFTSAMSPEALALYTERFRRCSKLEADGETVELLDLQRIQGDTLNVHQPLTDSVLELPGESHGDGSRRVLEMKDLFVRFRPPELPRIVDDAGRVYIPAHLGGAGYTFMPVLVRYLAAFGPSEFSAVFPPRRPHREDPEAMTLWNRLVAGNVVLARKKWAFPPEWLGQRLSGSSEARAFLEINRWRRENDIPEKVFLVERFHNDVVGLYFKPQYMDFSSPLFLSLFQSAVDTDASRVSFEEALPTPEMLPKDSAGRTWVTELLFDSLVLYGGAQSNESEFSPSTLASSEAIHE